MTASLEARLAWRLWTSAPIWLAALLVPSVVHEVRRDAAWEASRALPEFHRSADDERALRLSRADLEGAERALDQAARKSEGIDFPGRQAPPDDLEPWVYEFEGDITLEEAERYLQGRAPRRLSPQQRLSPGLVRTGAF